MEGTKTIGTERGAESPRGRVKEQPPGADLAAELQDHWVDLPEASSKSGQIKYGSSFVSTGAETKRKSLPAKCT